MSTKNNTSKVVVKKKVAKKVVKSATPKAPSQKVKINTSNAICVLPKTFSPTSNIRRHTGVTREIQESHKTDVLEANVKILRNEKGKLYPELQAFVTLKNKLKVLIEKYCLDVSLRGGRITSIHLVKELETEIAKLNGEFEKQAQICVSKLGEWIEADKKKLNGSFDLSLYPDKAYFEKYGVSIAKFPLSSEMVDFSNDELIQSANKERYHRLFDTVSGTFEAITSYINGDKNRFTEKGIEATLEEMEMLKRNNVIDDEEFNKLVDSMKESINQIDTSKIRDSKSVIEKGIVKPSNGGRGRPRHAVTQETIDKNQSYLNTEKEKFNTTVSNLEKACEGIF